MVLEEGTTSNTITAENAARFFAMRNWNVTILDNLSRHGGEQNLRWLRDGATFDFEEVDIRNRAAVDRILAEDFTLVTGRGKVYGKGELLKAAREKQVIYEHQEEEAGSQKVRVWSDTAVVTALLWIKAVQEGNPVDYKLWFSDTYIRTPAGWRYVFGQAALPLPKADAK